MQLCTVMPLALLAAVMVMVVMCTLIIINVLPQHIHYLRGQVCSEDGMVNDCTGRV